MEVIGTQQIQVTHEIKASECARITRSYARNLGFDKARVGEAEIVARELATNTNRYANGGTLFIQATRSGSQPKLEFFAWDKSPCIPDPELAQRDGHSSSDSLGHGLGAIGRLSNTFVIDSKPGEGTRLYVQILQERKLNPQLPEPRRGLPATGGVSIPMLGELENGDDWATLDGVSSCKLLVVDGLDHGPTAAKASQAATEIAMESRDQPRDVMIDRIHQGLVGTRGAVGATLTIDLSARRLEFTGIGNIHALYATIAALMNNHQKTMDDCTVLAAKESGA